MHAKTRLRSPLAAATEPCGGGILNTIHALTYGFCDLVTTFRCSKSQLQLTSPASTPLFHKVGIDYGTRAAATGRCTRPRGTYIGGDGAAVGRHKAGTRAAAEASVSTVHRTRCA
eukprot:1429776-Prymnesium_polylepis.2